MSPSVWEAGCSFLLFQADPFFDPLVWNSLAAIERSHAAF